MDGSLLGLVELGLVAALALGFGIQQLWSLRREKARDAIARKAAAAQPANDDENAP